MRALTLSLLLLAGCAVAQEPEAPIASQTEALQRRNNGGESFCPGGGSPACVACSSGKCVDACTGSYSCSDNCGGAGSGGGTNVGSCRSSGLSPSIGGGIRL